jgi:hypothetical protein
MTISANSFLGVPLAILFLPRGQGGPEDLVDDPDRQESGFRAGAPRSARPILTRRQATNLFSRPRATVGKMARLAKLPSGLLRSHRSWRHRGAPHPEPITHAAIATERRRDERFVELGRADRSAGGPNFCRRSRPSSRRSDKPVRSARAQCIGWRARFSGAFSTRRRCPTRRVALGLRRRA